MRKMINCYEINIRVVVRKNYWHNDNDIMDEDIIKSKVQSGLEIPIESIDVVVKD